MWPAETPDVVVEVGLQLDLDRVLAIHRKGVSDGDAAARTERQVFAQSRVLNQQPWDVVGLDHRTRQRPTQRLARDFLCSRHVPIEQCGRDRQHIRDVVEAVLIGIVGRQQRADVDLDAEKIADRVGVLRAVQAVHGRPAGIHVRRSRPIEFGLYTSNERECCRGIGTRPARRRHRAGAEFPHHVFPLPGVSPNLRRVEGVERQACCLQPLVVARDAVAGEEFPIRRGRRCARLRRIRGGLAGRQPGRPRRAGENTDSAADDDHPRPLPHSVGSLYLSLLLQPKS